MNIPEMDDPKSPSLLPGGGDVLSATDADVMSCSIWPCIPTGGTSGSLFNCMPCGSWPPWWSIVDAEEWPPCWSGGHCDPNNSWNWLFIFRMSSFFKFKLFKLFEFAANYIFELRIEFAFPVIYYYNCFWCFLYNFILLFDYVGKAVLRITIRV